MAPPSFVSCFVCQKDFGSRSIHIHVPGCLDKWRKENNAKRKPEREPSPSPPPNYPVTLQLRAGNNHRPLSGGARRIRPTTARLDKPMVLNDTLRTEIDMSKMTKDMIHKMPVSITSKAPMSMTAVTTSTTTPTTVSITTSSDYSSGDFTSSSSSPLGGNNNKSGPEEDDGILTSGSGDADSDPEEEIVAKKPNRPRTMRLARPPRQRGVPVIIPTAARAPTPRRGTYAIIRAYPPKQKKKNTLEEVFTGPKTKPLKIPEPCMTCGKEQNPERFHSHPLHMTKFKAKDKPSSKENRQKNANKRIVTKPLPLMYKSKKVLGKVNGHRERNNIAALPTPHDPPYQNGDRKLLKKHKSHSEESLQNLDQTTITAQQQRKNRQKKPLKTRSADNSPHRGKSQPSKDGKKVDPPSDTEGNSPPADKSLPLSHYIKNFKTASDKKDDFTIDFFEKDEEEQSPGRESPFHNPNNHNNNLKRNTNGSGNSTNSTSSNRTFGGLNTPQHSSLARRGTVVIARGGPGNHSNNHSNVSSTQNSPRSNLIRRPNNKLDERPVEEPSDDEELPEGDIEVITQQPLENVPEDDVMQSPENAGSMAPRRITAIQEEGGKTGGRPGSTPRSMLLTCYICGREFGTRSLPIHEPRCIEKWERDNAAMPRHLQRPSPQRPDKPLTREEWNEYAWTASQAQLVPCWCGRTFFPERLEVHQKGCKPPPGREIAVKNRPSSNTSIYELPGGKRTISCYICGREFGSRSIAIHQPQCRNKWKAQNDALPPNLQRPEPSKPDIIYDDQGKVNREATEEAAWQSHLETLVKCPTCPRTFLPDRLAKHQKGCRGES